MCALAGAIGSHARPAQTVMIGDSITAAMPAGLCRGALNYGRPSATTRDLLKLTDAVLAARPQTIVIMAGVNDIAAGITPDETAANIEALRLLAPRSIVLAVMPVTEDYPRPGYNAAIERINERLPDAVRIDIPSRHYLGDGIHLRSAAYLVWRDRLRELGVCHRCRGPRHARACQHRNDQRLPSRAAGSFVGAGAR